jgi:hypothetical protein
MGKSAKFGQQRRSKMSELMRFFWGGALTAMPPAVVGVIYDIPVWYIITMIGWVQFLALHFYESPKGQKGEAR